MKIEIWSDIACPWCYIGKRRFEKALSEYEHKDAVEITWRSYELQPGGPQDGPEGAVEHLMAKYGRSREQVLEMLEAATQAAAGEGLAYNLPESKMTSTFDAHRLTKLAQEHGVLAEVMEGLMHAQQCEGADVGNPETLLGIGLGAGLAADTVSALLEGELFREDVLSDQARARKLGVSGVPFFVIDETHGISGAQSKEFFLEALRQLGPKPSPLNMISSATKDDAGACDDDGCEI